MRSNSCAARTSLRIRSRSMRVAVGSADAMRAMSSLFSPVPAPRRRLGQNSSFQGLEPQTLRGQPVDVAIATSLFTHMARRQVETFAREQDDGPECISPCHPPRNPVMVVAYQPGP